MPCPRLSLLLCTLLLLISLSSCRESTRKQASHWQPPSYETLPPAFTSKQAEQLQLPDYARAWRAPEGFGNFISQWNKENQGAQIIFAEEKDLPPKLKWQDGMSEPEWSDPQAKIGGHMRLAIQRSFPGTLSPIGSGSNSAMRSYLYDDFDITLVRIHPSSGKLIPGLAKRWAISEDGLSAYFEIDPQARYSDGEPLRLQDFITALFLRCHDYSLEPSAVAWYRQNFKSITLFGGNKLYIELRTPRPLAAFYLSIPALSTRFYAEYGPDFLNRYQWRLPPVLGGYQIDPEGLRMGHSLRMKRVENWWARERKFTRHTCNVASINYLFVNELTKAKEMLRIGQLDTLSLRDAVDWYEGMEIPEVHRGYIQRVQYEKIWPCNSLGIYLNGLDPTLADRNLRLGLHHAMDMQSVIDTTYRGDFVRLGSHFTGFGAYTDESIKARPYAPQLARKHFAQAGYTQEGADGILQKPDGTRLSLTVSSRIDPVYSEFMNLLAQRAAACGLELRHQSMDDTIFFTRLRNKELQSAFYSWSFSPPIPQPVPLFHSRYAHKVGSNNLNGMASDEMDAALDACQQARSEEELIRTHHKVQQLIHESALWIPAWTSTYWRFAQWHWVKWPQTAQTHFCPPRCFNPWDSQAYWIDEAEKAQSKKRWNQGLSFPEIFYHITLPRKP